MNHSDFYYTYKMLTHQNHPHEFLFTLSIGKPTAFLAKKFSVLYVNIQIQHFRYRFLFFLLDCCIFLKSNYTFLQSLIKFNAFRIKSICIFEESTILNVNKCFDCSIDTK